MSAKIMGLVWDLDLPPLDKLVLLAFADHADHQGNNVRPGLPLIMAKTRLKERAVQYSVQRLRQRGFLVPVRYATGGRGHTVEYRIDLNPPPPLKGALDDILLPPDDLQDNSDGTGPGESSPVDNSQTKGALDDILPLKGALNDTLSGERVHHTVGKGAPDGGKGAPPCTPSVRSKILNLPPPYPL